MVSILAASAFVVGCGDDEPSRSRNDPRCESAAPGCLARHEGCVFTDDGPVCEPCPLGERPALPYGGCAVFSPTLSHTFGTFVLAANEEQGGTCESWVLDNDEEVYVDLVESQTDGGFHHSVLFWVPEDFLDWPTGRWEDCYENGFDEVTAAASGGVLMPTSTEVEDELQQLPPGTAFRIPPRSRIIAAMHLKNGPTALTTSLRVKLGTVAAADVDVALAPSQLVVPALSIPGDAPSTFSGSCDVDAAYRTFTEGEALAMKVHAFVPHVHPALTAMEIKVVGGPQDGRTLVALGPYEPVTLGHVFDPPVDLAGATGLSVSCSYDPDLATDPSWGNGHEQKCETLILVDSVVAFAGVVAPGPNTPPAGVDGLRDWPCQVLTFPYPPVAPAR